jgi:DNA-binding CsgD family transcriptional regulator
VKAIADKLDLGYSTVYNYRRHEVRRMNKQWKQ